jgi:Novel STAND NTPase 1
MEYALAELFERRDGRVLSLDAYREIGGVSGALGRRAEELFAELDDDGKEAAHQLFLCLVALGGGTEDTRRRVFRSEVSSLDVNQQAMAAVIDPFGASRQLSFDRDTKTGHPSRFSGVSFPRTRRSPPAPGDHALRLLDTGEHVLRVAEREAPSRPPGLRLPRLIVFQQTRRTLGRRACSAPTRRGSRARPRRGRSGSRRR